MTKTRTAWLALLLLGSVSAVAAMLTGSWRAPAAVEEASNQAVVQAEPVDNTLPTAGTTETTGTEVASREGVDPSASLLLRGAELPAAPPPAAPETMTSMNTPSMNPPNTNSPNMNNPETNAPNINIMGRRWHDAGAATKLTTTPPNAQQLKKLRDSKAEMRAKRSKAAANVKACSQSNDFQNLLRKLYLSPPCAI
jgi:hypothetical protein